MVADTAQHHPKGVSQAYADIGNTLANYGFNRVQGSLYTNAYERTWPTCFAARGGSVGMVANTAACASASPKKAASSVRKFTAEHAEDAELR